VGRDGLQVDQVLGGSLGCCAWRHQARTGGQDVGGPGGSCWSTTRAPGTGP
jgi:hypothetical protein